MVLAALAGPAAAAGYYVSAPHLELKLIGLLANLGSLMVRVDRIVGHEQDQIGGELFAFGGPIANRVGVDRIVPHFFPGLHVHDQRNFLLTEMHL